MTLAILIFLTFGLLAFVISKAKKSKVTSASGTAAPSKGQLRAKQLVSGLLIAIGIFFIVPPFCGFVVRKIDSIPHVGSYRPAPEWKLVWCKRGSLDGALYPATKHEGLDDNQKVLVEVIGPAGASSFTETARTTDSGNPSAKGAWETKSDGVLVAFGRWEAKKIGATRWTGHWKSESGGATEDERIGGILRYEKD